MHIYSSKNVNRPIACTCFCLMPCDLFGNQLCHLSCTDSSNGIPGGRGYRHRCRSIGWCRCWRCCPLSCHPHEWLWLLSFDWGNKLRNNYCQIECQRKHNFVKSSQVSPGKVSASGPVMAAGFVVPEVLVQQHIYLWYMRWHREKAEKMCAYTISWISDIHIYNLFIYVCLFLHLP